MENFHAKPIGISARRKAIDTDASRVDSWVCKIINNYDIVNQEYGRNVPSADHIVSSPQAFAV